MARRTKAELIAEIKRVDAALAIWSDFLSAELDDFAPIELETVETALARADENSWPLSMVLSGYQEALNDFQISLTDKDFDQPEFAAKFFAFYREKTGRDYISDFGDPVKTARAILRRGVIADETEYYFINEIMIDTEQIVFKPNELARVGKMIEEFLAQYVDGDRGEPLRD